MLFKKYFALVSLLATFSIAVPSPPEESEDLASYNIYINELKLVVHCYFNSDSPECKDEPADASDDPNATDVPDPAESETPEEEDNSNEANGKEFSYSSITMINRANETDMPPPKKYSKDDDFPEGLYEEVPDEINRYEEMEQFKVRWPERIYLRDNICLFCYAVLAEQEILNEPYRSRARKELGRREVTPFDATNKFFVCSTRHVHSFPDITEWVFSCKPLQANHRNLGISKERIRNSYGRAGACRA